MSLEEESSIHVLSSNAFDLFWLDNEAIQEVEERKEKLGYQYKTGFIQAVKQSIMVNHLIMQQIQKNIQRRVAEGFFF